ncbi:MAG TPA: aspartate/glutamate racemase family protein, partial [Pirellulaceae bacterium]|nr:aspartate/glutamate racemase family protein [Pirellulaceae bacterium]
ESHQPGADGRPDFAGERFIYFGDQANMPYGNYPSSDRELFLRELIVKDAVFLLGRRYWSRGDAGYGSNSNLSTKSMTKSTTDANSLGSGNSSTAANKLETNKLETDKLETDKPPVKAIVIACNTATAYGIGDLRAAMQRWDVPVEVIGVVEAGSHSVLQRLSKTEKPGAVGVLATVGTCSCRAYPVAIEKSAEAAKRPLPPVVQQGSIGLAGAIEGDFSYVDATLGVGPEAARSTPPGAGSAAPGSAAQAPASAPSQTSAPRHAPYLGPTTTHKTAPLDPKLMSRYAFDARGLVGTVAAPESLQLNSIDNYVRYDVVTLVETHRRSGERRPLDQVVLGCTHFPLAAASIRRELARLREWRDGDGSQPYRALIAADVALIDPAEATARELYQSLTKGQLFADGPPASGDRFFMSVPNPQSPGVELARTGGLSTTYKYGRDCGRFEIEDVKCVPIVESLIPAPTAHLIREKLPEVAKRLKFD